METQELDGLNSHEAEKREEKTSSKFLKLIPLSPEISFMHYKKRFEKNHFQTLKIDDRYFFGIILGDDFRYKDSLGTWRRANRYDIFINKEMGVSKLEFVQSGSYEFLLFGILPGALEKMIESSQTPAYHYLLEIEKKIYKLQANLKIIRRAYDLCIEEREGLQAIGQVYILMELIIKQFLEEASDTSSNRKFDFYEWEIDELLKTSHEIKEYPGRNYSVGGISKKTGISIPRLQAGFKEKHGLTVALFIKERRLKRAEKLIRTTNLNVSEVAYQIGLTSRSYFSRIFKEKYHCTPSEYKKTFSAEDA